MEIKIRKANLSDRMSVFNLSNLASTREYSISQTKILFEDHIHWYDEVLKNENIILFIVTNENNKFLGQVRFNINLKSALISISIEDEIKGKGYSLYILQMAQKLIVEEKGIEHFVAIVNNKNIPSIKLFKRAGYNFVKSEGDFSEFQLEIRRMGNGN